MGNFFGAFSSEVFRPLVTLLIPGAIALSSWFIALLWQFPNFRHVVETHHADSTFLILLVTVFVGLFIEDLGAHVEALFDERAAKKKEEHFDNWFRYLRMRGSEDLIGRRYIRTLVVRMKFEFGVMFAAFIAAGGVIWLRSLGLPPERAVIIGFLLLSLTGWEFYEAGKTHEALAKNRKELLLAGRGAVGAKLRRWSS